MLRVSVIIPVYNAASWLRVCLDSVLGQTLRDIEVICVDDGSTDGSLDVLAEYAAGDSRVRMLTQANSGQGKARNAGMKVAGGEYVCFVDADDELSSSDALERLVGKAGEGQLDALFFDAETCIDDESLARSPVVRAEAYIRKHDYSAICSGKELLSRFLRNHEYTVSPCLVFLRRKFLTEKGVCFPDAEIFYEDHIFMTRVLLAATRTSHRPWRLYRRRVRAGSTMTSRPTMRHLRGSLACYENCLALMAMAGWDGKTRRVLADRLAMFKLRVRRIVDSCPALSAAAAHELSPSERSLLQAIRVYPLSEKIVNGWRCLRDNGLMYTLRRIFMGRQ